MLQNDVRVVELFTTSCRLWKSNKCFTNLPSVRGFQQAARTGCESWVFGPTCAYCLVQTKRQNMKIRNTFQHVIDIQVLAHTKMRRLFQGKGFRLNFFNGFHAFQTEGNLWIAGRCWCASNGLKTKNDFEPLQFATIYFNCCWPTNERPKF